MATTCASAGPWWRHILRPDHGLTRLGNRLQQGRKCDLGTIGQSEIRRIAPMRAFGLTSERSCAWPGSLEPVAPRAR
jgi:hypothetical protein